MAGPTYTLPVLYSAGFEFEQDYEHGVLTIKLRTETSTGTMYEQFQEAHTKSSSFDQIISDAIADFESTLQGQGYALLT